MDSVEESSEARAPQMQQSGYPRNAPKLRIPWWVRITIWGSPTRAWVMAFFWISALIGVACIAAGFLFWPAFLLAPVPLLCAVPYLASARWMDRYGGWSQRDPRDAWKI